MSLVLAFLSKLFVISFNIPATWPPPSRNTVFLIYCESLSSKSEVKVFSFWSYCLMLTIYYLMYLPALDSFMLRFLLFSSNAAINSFCDIWGSLKIGSALIPNALESSSFLASYALSSVEPCRTLTLCLDIF